MARAAALARVWLRKNAYVGPNGKPLFAAQSLVKWYSVRDEPHQFKVLEDRLRVIARDDSKKLARLKHQISRFYTALQAGRQSS